MNRQKPLDATLFIRNRPQPLSITNERISHILWYLAECYTFLLQSKNTYSKEWIKNNTTITLEDYLKMDFVDKYLIPNKHLLSSRLPALEQINFSYETQKRYIDSIDQKQKPDKIDIFINKLGLQKVWNEHDEFIYLAVECKRIKSLSSATDYVGDIRKFCNRDYLQLRLPMETMIGFIENQEVTHSSASNKINEALKSQTDVRTVRNLQSITYHSQIDCIYSSIHSKAHDSSKQFTITHFLFNYSNIVVN